MKKKLTCHCGGVEAEVNIPETGIEKLMRCNCTLCKRKGYIIGVLGENDFTLTKGKELLKLYQYYTNTAKHFFCSVCVEFILTITQELIQKFLALMLHVLME